MKILKQAWKEVWHSKPQWEKKGWKIVLTVWAGMNTALLLPNLFIH